MLDDKQWAKLEKEESEQLARAERCCTYWGSDGGGREFDVLVDGRTIATQRLQNHRPGKVYDEGYALPPELTRG